MTKRLSDFSVLTFDCYGTLIDWEGGIWDALQPLLMANPSGAVTRDIALEAFAEAESRQEQETPGMIYPEILVRVHQALASRFGLTTSDRPDQAFGQSVPFWPAFADTADALRALKKHYKLVILSNIHEAGFAASNRKLGVDFDGVYTAEAIGSYKPDPRNFSHLLSHLAADQGIAKEQILHTAQSLFHDHAPAGDAGLAKAWIDRQGLSQGGNWGATAKLERRPDVDFLFPTLAALAEAREAETA